MIASVIKGHNDLRLVNAITIYSVFEDYKDKYYVEILDENLSNARPFDSTSLQLIKDVFQTSKQQSKAPTVSAGNILFYDPHNRIVIWKTMTAKRGQYPITIEDEVITVPVKNLLWMYNREPFIFFYQKWQGNNTKVRNALLPHVMGNGHICKGTAKFPEFKGDLITFCKECENAYASAGKSSDTYIKLWQKEGLKKLMRSAQPIKKYM